MNANRALLLALTLGAALAAWRGAVLLGRHLATGILVAPEPEYTLRLNAGRGERIVEGHHGRATLPACRYLLEDWSARQRDAGGHVWEVRRAPGEPSRVVEVPAGGRAALPLAAPIEPELVIEQSGPDVSFRLRLKGAGGETCGEVRVDGRRVPPPALRIEDAHGRVVAWLRFEDNCGSGCAQAWRAPRGLSQPLRAVPDADLGPFRPAAAAFRFRLDGPPAPAAAVHRPAPGFSWPSVDRPPVTGVRSAHKPGRHPR